MEETRWERLQRLFAEALAVVPAGARGSSLAFAPTA